MRSKKRDLILNTLLFITMSLIVLPYVVGADIVYLKSGKKIKGKITKLEGAISIKTETGLVTRIPNDKIEKIVREETAGQEEKSATQEKKKVKVGYKHVAPWGSVMVTEPQAPIKLNGKVVYNAKKDASFIVYGIKGNNYLVSVFVGGQNKSGWISGKQVVWLPAGRVRAIVANVPITVSGKEITKARKGSWYQVLLKKKGYYLVEVPAKKKRGWINERFCQWGSDMKVEVVVKRAAIRQGVKVVATATKGQLLDVYRKVYAKQKGFFYLVKSVGSRGKTGWLRAEQATLQSLEVGKD